MSKRSGPGATPSKSPGGRGVQTSLFTYFGPPKAKTPAPATPAAAPASAYAPAGRTNAATPRTPMAVDVPTPSKRPPAKAFGAALAGTGALSSSPIRAPAPSPWRGDAMDVDAAMGTPPLTSSSDAPASADAPGPRSGGSNPSLGRLRVGRRSESFTKKRSLIVSDDDEDAPVAGGRGAHDGEYVDDGPVDVSSDDGDDVVVSDQENNIQRSASKRAKMATPGKSPASRSSPWAAGRTPLSGRTPLTPSNARQAPAVLSSPLASREDQAAQRAARFQEANRNTYAWLEHVRDAEGREPTDPEYDPSSLYVPQAAWAKFSDFERQFWEVKAKYFDTVVFFKKGKFYELYERDADLGHREFDLRISDNGRGAMRMAGVPEASFEEWAIKFVARGYKVARVDQMETATGKTMREKQTATKDKVIRRELTAVLTQGTLVDSAFLMSDLSTYCLALREGRRGGDGAAPEVGGGGDLHIAAAFVDTSTAQVYLSVFDDDEGRSRLDTLLMQVKPRELVIDRGNLSPRTLKTLKAQCPDAQWNTLAFWPRDAVLSQVEAGGYWPDGMPETAARHAGDDVALGALGGLIMYLQRLKLDHLLGVNTLAEYDLLQQASSLVMDGAALANLNVFDGERNLYSLLDQCATPMGRRLLRTWLCHPLRHASAIRRRQAAVAEWLGRPADRGDAVARLSALPDLERTIGRVHMGCCKLKDFVAMLAGFAGALALVRDLQAMDLRAERLVHLTMQFPDVADTLAYFETAFDHRAAVETGHIEPRAGVLPEYDEVAAELEAIQGELRDHLTTVRQKLRVAAQYKDTGKDKNQIEVPLRTEVPATWRKVSGTKAVARYHSPEVLRLNVRLSEAQEVRNTLLQSATQRVLHQFNEHYTTWRTCCGFIAEIDALIGLASVAQVRGFECVPDIVEDAHAWIQVKELRHPCFAQDLDFIPNNMALGHPTSGNASEGPGDKEEAARAILLTGSNMGGKTTQMRAIGLCVLLAQVGSLVPAARCALSPFDAIFTRIGARDNLVAGQSTFMVELHEASRILRDATARSLVLCDELGRGTSTFDGHAIAFAVLHQLAFASRACVVFSTHYAGLTREFGDDGAAGGGGDMAAQPRTAVPAVQNWHMACLEDAATRAVTFLYKLTRGAASRSHGMNVARMAGLPDSIVEHAYRVADDFERMCLGGPASGTEPPVGGDAAATTAARSAAPLLDLSAAANLATLMTADLDGMPLATLHAMQASIAG